MHVCLLSPFHQLPQLHASFVKLKRRAIWCMQELPVRSDPSVWHCVCVGNELLASRHNNSIEVRAESTRVPPRPPLYEWAGRVHPCVLSVCTEVNSPMFHLQWPRVLLQWKCTLYPKPFWSSKTVPVFIFLHLQNGLQWLHLFPSGPEAPLGVV